MANASCLLVAPLLDPYVNRDMSEESIALVEKHILFCAECAFEVRTLEQTVIHLQSAIVETDTFLPAFRERMNAKLQDSFDDILTLKPDSSEFQHTLPL